MLQISTNHPFRPCICYFFEAGCLPLLFSSSVCSASYAERETHTQRERKTLDPNPQHVITRGSCGCGAIICVACINQDCSLAPSLVATWEYDPETAVVDGLNPPPHASRMARIIRRAKSCSPFATMQTAKQYMSLCT